MPGLLFCTVSSSNHALQRQKRTALPEMTLAGSAGRQQEEAHPWHSHALSQLSSLDPCPMPELSHLLLVQPPTLACTGRTSSTSGKGLGLWMLPEATVQTLGLHPFPCPICSHPLSSPHHPKANFSMEKDAAHVQRALRDRRHPNNSRGHCQARGDKQKEHTSDSPCHRGQTVFPALQGSVGVEANPSHSLNARKRHKKKGKSHRSAVPHG